jgi:hypothetical protein
VKLNNWTCLDGFLKTRDLKDLAAFPDLILVLLGDYHSSVVEEVKDWKR